MVRARDLRIGDIMYPIIAPYAKWQVYQIEPDIVWLKALFNHPLDEKESECSIDTVWKDWNLCEVTRINLILEKYEDS